MSDTVEKIEDLILERWVIKISATVDTSVDDYEQGVLEHANFSTLPSNQTVSAPENAGEEVLKLLVDYVRDIIDVDCDDDCIKDAIKESLEMDEDSHNMLISVTVDAENNEPTEEQTEKWKKGKETLYVADHDVNVEINGASIPLHLVNELLFPENENTEDNPDS